MSHWCVPFHVCLEMLLSTSTFKFQDLQYEERDSSNATPEEQLAAVPLKRFTNTRVFGGHLIYDAGGEEIELRLQYVRVNRDPHTASSASMRISYHSKQNLVRHMEYHVTHWDVANVLVVAAA